MAVHSTRKGRFALVQRAATFLASLALGFGLLLAGPAGGKQLGNSLTVLTPSDGSVVSGSVTWVVQPPQVLFTLMSFEM